MLAFIGFIALLVFGKFLWDTYATGKTDKDWESYKKQEPEKAARIVNSATFDMSTSYKSNPMHQQISLNMIAALFECDASEAEETYKKAKREELAIDLGNVEKFKQEMNEARQHKYKQAVSMEFDPNNTPAAFLERWMHEVLDEFTKSKIGVGDFLRKAASLASKNQHEDVLAVVSKALNMIKSGDLTDDDRLTPLLLNVAGESYMALNEIAKACIFFDCAIDKLRESDSDNEAVLNTFLSNKEKADKRFDQSGAAGVASDVLDKFDRERGTSSNSDYADKVKISVITQAQLFIREGEKSQLWLTLANGDKLFINKQIAQSNLDSALMCVGSDLTLLADCDISYETHAYNVGDAFVDDKGKVVTGERAGLYENKGSKSINVVIDYASAVAANRAANRLADRLAAKAEARLLAKEAAKAALAKSRAVVVAPVEQADTKIANTNNTLTESDEAKRQAEATELANEEKAKATAEFFASTASAFGAVPKQIDEPVADKSEESADKAQRSAEDIAKAVATIKSAFTRKPAPIVAINQEEDDAKKSFEAGDEIIL